MTTQSPDAEVLNPETSKPETSATVATPSPAGSRCQHRYANGKRCRQPSLESPSGLCFHHFRLSNPAVAFPSGPGSDSADLSKDLLPGGTQFSSADDLREFLTRLLILMTEGRVSPRRAAVLAYITNQLLHTHSFVLKEEELENRFQPIVFDLPRPKRDEGNAVEESVP
jgi:hypothetical protein